MLSLGRACLDSTPPLPKKTVAAEQSDDPVQLEVIEVGRGAPAERPPDENAPFAALAFKVMSDPFVGKLTYFRVYSGTLGAGAKVLNASTGRTERIGRILEMHANHREEREEIYAGDIVEIGRASCRERV